MLNIEVQTHHHYSINCEVVSGIHSSMADKQVSNRKGAGRSLAGIAITHKHLPAISQALTHLPREVILPEHCMVVVPYKPTSLQGSAALAWLSFFADINAAVHCFH